MCVFFNVFIAGMEEMGTVAVKNICFVTCNGHCLTVS